ncbi:MAG: hypothetical protein D6696_09220 [Acidobacteria bacterium]|nr:MAG: hypothetical protein D6696_09220 [Acidobacteriota bacterium]
MDTTLSIAEARLEPQADLDRLMRRALVVGLAGAVATAAAYVLAPLVFYRSYLVGCLLWLSVAAGLWGLGMLNHLTGGRWGVLARRVFEAAGRTLPFFLLLFLPLWLNLEALYPWADAEHVAGDSLLQKKAAYLNPGAFVVRTAGTILLWSLIAYLLSWLSHRHDASGDDGLRRHMQRLSAAGAVIFVLSGTFASVDWIMSLEPHWFSSLFGVAFVVGQGLSAFAFLVPMMIFLGRRQPLKGLVKPRLFHDYGKLMLAFVMLWTYMAIGQYLIIWSGNLPEEITWYLARNTHGWKLLTVGLMVGHFALPFAILLSADLKKNPRRLAILTFWVLAMRWLDFYWQVVPSAVEWQAAQGLLPAGPRAGFHPFDLAPAVAIGGVWVALLAWQLKDRAILPVKDPILKEALAHG